MRTGCPQSSLFIFILKKPLFYFCIFLLLHSCQKEEAPGFDGKTLGTAARHLLSADHFQSLSVEIHYMEGFAPSQAAVDSLNTFLNNYLNKPAGITILLNKIPPAGKPVYSLQEIKNLESQRRQSHSSGTNISVFILITDSYIIDTSYFGLSYHNTSFALSGQNIREHALPGNASSLDMLYATLLRHEFGHLLGLVNIRGNAQHHHNDGGYHCNNSQCLMYHDAGTLPAAAIPPLDANCRQDLKNMGGK